jgi:hypothetical protein
MLERPIWGRPAGEGLFKLPCSERYRPARFTEPDPEPDPD